MALFVGGFLIFNAFNMTVLQRTREIGMLRTLGATRGRITGSVLREAALLGVVGAVARPRARAGARAGAGRADARRSTSRSASFASPRWRRSPPSSPGSLTAVLGALYPARRAGRTSPIRAVLGSEGLRSRPRPRRAALGAGADRRRPRGRLLARRGRRDDAGGRRGGDDRDDRDLLRHRDGGAVRRSARWSACSPGRCGACSRSRAGSPPTRRARTPAAPRRPRPR